MQNDIYSLNTKEQSALTAIILFGLLMLLLTLTACQQNIPAKVDHTISGNATVTNVIRIEVVIPDVMTKAFNTTCNDKCNGDKVCSDLCIAQQTTNYTNNIISLIQQFQQLAAPSPTPTP